MAAASPQIIAEPQQSSAAADQPVRERRMSVLASWLRTQSVNVTRHAAALRPFRREEFGSGPAAPSEGHLQAANKVIETLRTELLKMASGVTGAGRVAAQDLESGRIAQATYRKQQAHAWVQSLEKVWDFYLELFGQRQSQYGEWLLSCDRIGLDCYQHVYLGLGVAKTIPAPSPFSYMRTGFSPATFRRGIPLQRLAKQVNPFPLIQLPYHRLLNPWTLGAILHEVSHNFQSELGLSREVPRRVGLALLKGGMGRNVAMTWVRCNREIFADLCGLLLGGPAVVASLMDVIGLAPSAVTAFAPGDPHPTPYLRALLSFELLERMGFPREAARYRGAWTRMYPDPAAGDIPAALLRTCRRAIPLVVDAMCFRPYRELGNRSLSQVVRFQPKEQEMVAEAAQRLAAGTDPGVVPERFLIGAARLALDAGMARPGVIAENFYRELARR